MLKSEASPTTGRPARVNALPLSRFGRGISVRHQATVVLAFLFVGACAVRILSFVLGGPPKGLCLSLVSFLYLSFLTCLEEGIAPSCFRLRCYEGGGWALD